ncbi:MAG: DEAD/DEAH box helicase [Bacilli bacterium]|jgi:ATP-dependent RNA helicase RhlE|nr:DEAD/DEAH box helicase [Bacilli bacterium]MDY0064089.1 DEAD/DEAH box helicase [Bacilli bacterium]
MSFNDLKIIDPILRAIKEEGFTIPTPIQTEAIPQILEGRDLLGSAQTGTGKTAAFAIPILQQIQAKKRTDQKNIQALILTPTRELAAQIYDNFIQFSRHLPIKCAVIFGGVSQKPQTLALSKGVDILIATPGRLLDLVNQKFIQLNKVSYFVLDEADHMLDMGFILDVKKIINLLPASRQTLLFSATMPSEIIHLANTILINPIRIAITPVTKTLDTITQYVFYVNKTKKTALLIHLLRNEQIDSALIFSRTKHGANKIAKALNEAGLKADAIHGNKSQTARTKALGLFKAKKVRILVATDIASRGIDIDELSHVINFDLPEVPDTYIHRIGRTARAGLNGIAYSFCSSDERTLLRDIQKHIGQDIPSKHISSFTEEVCEVSIETKPIPSSVAMQRMKGWTSSRTSKRKRPSSFR